MTARCVMCHGEGMQMKGVRLDSEEWINRHAASHLPAGGGDQGHANE